MFTSWIFGYAIAGIAARKQAKRSEDISLRANFRYKNRAPRRTGTPLDWNLPAWLVFWPVGFGHFILANYHGMSPGEYGLYRLGARVEAERARQLKGVVAIQTELENQAKRDEFQETWLSGLRNTRRDMEKEQVTWYQDCAYMSWPVKKRG